MKNKISTIVILLIIILFNCKVNFSQKVGLVMSGGGASGMAHIGVIKALEENNIPIDYITGTSAGALVGSLYAIGFSAKQLEQIIRSQEMLNMSKGLINNKYHYFFKEKPRTPSIISFKLNEKLDFFKALPLNFTDPSLIDYYFLENYSVPSAVANYNFDSLLVPFRCVAADIDHNKAIVFKDGNLAQTVRASMTFPFYLPPIRIDSTLLLDGGLYNNFPADIMYNDFLPDVIIGSSTTAARKAPKDDDLLSQVRSMMQIKSDFNLKCKEGLIINPKVRDIGTFNFENRVEAFQRGYDEAMGMMDSIKALIHRRVDSSQLAIKRLKYLKATRKKIIIDNINVKGVNKREEKYIRSVLKDLNKNVSLDEIKARYFKLILDDKIEFIFPKLTLNKHNNLYTLDLEVRKKARYDVRLGGSFSSRSVNTGYIGLDLKHIDRYFAMTASVNSYLGRFYSSFDLSSRIDFPLDVPFYIEPFITYNRWDYYRSISAFFEDTKPSFLIKNETFFGGSIGFPIENDGRLKFTYKNGFLNNQYYQSDLFVSTDTADNTKFFFDNYGVDFESNSLDRMYLSKKGSLLKVSGNYISGSEINKPGSTSLLPSDTSERYAHDWLMLKVKYETYFDLGLDYKLGIEIEGVHSTQKFFNNYTSSVLMAPQYSPLQETKTLFVDEHSAHTYLAGGIKNVFPILPAFDIRLEGYVFQPYRSIVNDNKKAVYSSNFANTKRHYLLSGAIVYNSPLGPASFRANYMDYRKEKWSFMVNFNYTIFNRKALD